MKILRYVLFFVATTLAMAQGAHAKYGAIYYSVSSGSYGWSNNWDSQAQALGVAYNYCNNFAGDCRLLTVVRNGCAALARGTNLSYGYAYGQSLLSVRYNALRYCQQYGYRCVVAVNFCTTPSY